MRGVGVRRVLRAVVGAIAAALGADSLSSAGSQPATPDAAAVLKELYAASGGAKADALEGVEASGNFVAGGLAGTFSQRIDLKRGRDTFRFETGVIQGAQGTSADAAWWTDEKGLTTVEDTPDALADAKTQSYVDRSGWFHPAPGDAVAFAGEKRDGGETYELVRATPEGGRPVTLWIDAVTHRLARLVVVDSAQRETTSYYSDYRPIDGAWIAFTTRTSSGNPATDTVSNVDHLEFRAFSDKDFAPPPSVIHDARLVTGAKRASVPFSLIDNLIVVRVSLNGRPPAPFIFDTGGLNVLTPEAAREAGVAAAGAIDLNGTGEAQATAQLTRVPSYRLGPAELTDQQFIVSPLPFTFRPDPPVGVIGYELLRRFTVRIDYHRRELTLWSPGTPAPADSGARTPLHLGGRSMYVDASVGGAKGLFGVDTGDDGSVTLFAPFFKSHAIPVELPAQKVVKGGIGGYSDALMTRTSDLAIGPYEIPRPLVVLNYVKTGAFASDRVAGNLGELVFRNLVITFDLPGRALFMKKAPEFGYDQPYFSTGAEIGLGDKGVIGIAFVNPGSPAADAGLRAGDVVVAINGRPVAATPTSDVIAGLKPSVGGRVSLEVTRSGKPLHIEFVASDLLPKNGPLTIDPDLTP
jgi:hypothetical protein